ncbi:outer membrane beta-barrel protein [Aquimarina sediminis]|uniref:outer membrane beta-barrel protein n=1 Tax=Aquimarina sediminis TaxID=2070536 RepID=UPI000CA077BF|nr:outer membrane beta-barrel protein [Aquimarina sediminis]
MKKILITAVALVSFATAIAQDENTTEGFAKGDIFVSGSVGFNSQKHADDKLSSFEITPSVGYFISENITIGGRIGFESTKVEGDSFETDFLSTPGKSSTFSIGAFGRYYTTPANKFSIFGELAANYLSTKVDPDATTTDTTIDGFGIGLSPGVSYFLSSNFALEATWGALQYSTSKADFDGAESLDAFQIGLDLDDIRLGLLYKF